MPGDPESKLLLGISIEKMPAAEVSVNHEVDAFKLNVGEHPKVPVHEVLHSPEVFYGLFRVSSRLKNRKLAQGLVERFRKLAVALLDLFYVPGEFADR